MYKAQGQVANITKNQAGQITIHLLLEIDGMEEESQKTFSSMETYQKEHPQMLKPHDQVECLIHEDGIGFSVASMELI